MSAPPIPAPQPLHESLALAIACMVAAQIVFTAMDTMVKLLSDGFGAAQIVWGFFAAFTVTATVDAARNGSLRGALRTRRPLLHIVRALLLPVNMAAMVLALNLLPLATVTTVVCTFPLIVTALSVPILGEHVGPRRWTAVAIGFVGVLIVVRPGTDVFDPAAFVALFAGAVYALYLVLTRLLSRTDRSDGIALSTAWIGLAVFSFALPFDWRMPSLEEGLLLAFVALAGTIGHRLIIVAFSRAPASTLQPFTYLQVVWATGAGLVVFGHLPDGITLIGAGVIVASGLYAWWRERQVTTP
ncbi:MULTISPECIES: DMT family transporter [Thalassobaculum]|uniref:EamA-like transporter family protein n=1 Tax=Thalassobaculum litoreum DSM 18839 TaxID=1123362 RepID=A0A8G2BLA7_9PROT|nr:MULTISPECIES: DMT family transporter [Thalassobaculum]SDG28772.1 EamA-like transporter family protein [Thalassobaculum litoreum DSM 18839]